VSEVLYRKWRPQSFSEVVGQDAVTQTLRNSVSSGRLAHAYLFCGPRGTGKTTLGRLLAKAVNCGAPSEGEPCNTCESCRAYLEGRAVDFVEQDAASHNSVDDIRQLRENVVLTPMAGGRKVYLLDEVHMLSTAADNALLKTLEEPPPHIVFVLATTEPHKVSSTIISRCQRFDLKRIANSAVVGRLAFICEKENYRLEDGALDEIARASGGSLRDAINGLEQVITYYGPSPTLEQVQEALGLSMDARSGELARHALDGDLGAALKTIAAVRDDGADMKQFAKQTALYFRGLLLSKAGAGEALDLPKEIAAEVKEQAAARDRVAIVRALKAFGLADFRDDPHSSLPLELAVLELASEETAQPAAPTAMATGQKPPRAEPAPVPPEGEPKPSLSIPSADLEVPTTAAVANNLQAPSEPVPGNGVPAPAAPAAAGDDGLLDRVRLACRDVDKILAGLLNGSCEVRAVEHDAVVLGFYHTFHLERAESEPNAGKLAKLFSDALGRPVRIRFEKHEPPERPQGGGGHLVQAARELGARPITPGYSDEGGESG
jgi:DNA polymerase-3 subunit gamma/tau